MSALAWIKDSVIYQLFPQSFHDSNGDGIGDLEGIIRRLDYIQSIGANVIWLNPCFDSPFKDAGYDIRDFFKVAARYGSEAELVGLFEEARKRGIRVILDFVAGHTSNEHPLFISSATALDGEDAGRYIWKNRDYDPARGPTSENYVQNFFPFQPALNFGYAQRNENWQDPVDAPGPTVNRRWLREIMEYWLERGASGFRVDMASSLVKEDPGHAETIRLWREIREWLDECHPDCLLVAEWSNPAEAIQGGFHLDFLMHFNVDAYRSLFFNETGLLDYPGGACYFDAHGSGSPWPFMNEYARQLKAVADNGYISIPSANHDFQRLRCGTRSWEALPVAWVFLLTQAGIPSIYMGDEIGMRFVPETPPKEGSTLEGIASPNAGTIKGERAGTRTPMQWDRSRNAGFSSAPSEALYLPLDPDPDRPTVQEQSRDPDSLFNFIRNLLRLRREFPVLGSRASYEFLNPEGTDYPMIIQRRHNSQYSIIVLNPSGQIRHTSIPVASCGLTVLLNEGVATKFDQDSKIVEVKASPFAFAIFISQG